MQVLNKYDNNKNEIIIKYYNSEENNRIFCEDFININKDNCRLLFKNKEYKLSEKYPLSFDKRRYYNKINRN